MNTVKKYWFFLGILAVSLLPLLDAPTRTAALGSWFKTHHGPDCSIFLVFLLSGLALQYRQIAAGISDGTGTLLSLAVTFLAAPVTALLFGIFPLPVSIYTGMVLIAVMPTTLSSGVVMTGLAGGNSVHALVITILGNTLAIFTIPVTLQLMIGCNATGTTGMDIDQSGLMLKIAFLVITPLTTGVMLRKMFPSPVKRCIPCTGPLSQISILFIIWMAMCHGRNDILQGMSSLFIILPLTFFYHLLLVVIGVGITRICNIEKGRRESVIIMGGQKTLPLSLIIQSSLFPDFGLAAVTCVLHHIIHLAMDALLVQYLKRKA